MSYKDKTVYDFDTALIYEYFGGLERQGPGSPEVTRRASGFIEGLNERSLIADLGCGTGGQMMVLAQSVPGHITGVELSEDFVRKFNRSAARLGLRERVEGVTGSMDDLPFEKGSLDLIWSEGAIYNIGFQKGLTLWREYLKPGGYVAVTEASWFTAERPAEIEDYWTLHYPDITTIAGNVAAMQSAGYIPVVTFTLPDSCWTDNYFKQGCAAQERLLSGYPGNTAVEEFVAAQRLEARMYDTYGSFYGYVFYIGKKI